jgi:hypothetical protein
MKARSRIPAIIFTASFSILAFEITLTRIFSITLWYHFAFMVISIAMLGLSLSGILISSFPGLNHTRHLDLYGLLLGISIFSGYLISGHIPFDPVKFQWSGIQFVYVGCYYLILLFPFLFAGLILSTSFYAMSKTSGIIYAIDLAGAASGSLGVLFLLNNLHPEQTVFVISLPVLLVILVKGRKFMKIISLGAIMLFILAATSPFIKMAPRISPYKEMPQAMLYPNAVHLGTFQDAFSRIDTFKSPAVRFAPGLSLAYTDPLPDQLGCSLDGDQVMAITATSDQKKLKFLLYLPASAPFEIGKKTDVLIINPGGGLPVVMAGYYHAKNIDNIESNSLLVRVIKTYYRTFTGQLYLNNTWTGMGRAWLKSSKRTYDIIDISLLKNTPSGPTGLSEDYQLTVEAFQTYISALKPDGLISLNLFVLPPPRQSFRLMSTLLEAMRRAGIGHPRRHIAAIRSWGSINILMKKSSFSGDEISKLKHFARSRMFDLIACPAIRAEESNFFVQTRDNIYFNAFQALLDDGKRDRFIKEYLFDIAPTFDDSPFFHYFLKTGNIKKIYDLTGGKWDYFIREGYILPLILIQVTGLGFLLIVLPYLFRVKSRKIIKGKGGSGPPMLFFALLGLGFMFVEISLVQEMIRVTTNPQVAVAVVLASILTGAGCGSYLSFRNEFMRKPVMMAVIPVIIIILAIMLIPLLSDYMLPLPFFIRLVMIFSALLPLGFFLGIPFPAGIRHLGENRKGLIPWAWAVNGFFSVLGPILAMMIALSIGFSAVLWLSALAYLGAFLVFCFLKKNH